MSEFDFTPLQVPPEIWTQIIYHLPIFYQKQLLGVSRLFHDITLPLVFSAVKIYFVGGTDAPDVIGTTDYGFLEEATENLMRKSWELLRHIVREPMFARLVKSISIIACVDTQAIFEQLSIADALCCLPNLQTFRWIGLSPPFSESIARCISPGLQTLSIKSRLLPAELGHLTHVTQLQLPTPFYYPDNSASDSMIIDENLLGYAQQVNAIDILSEVSPEFRSLVMMSSHIAEVPIRIYDILTELEICATSEAHLLELDLVFRHAIVLESLSLVGFIPTNLLTFSILPSDPAILPRLSSFRLSCEYETMDFIEGYSEPLCMFLQRRTQLRRLYIRVAGATWGFLSDVLSVIGVLPSLEVLGLHTGRNYFADNEIMMLAENLSPRLKALHLAIIWEHSHNSILSLVSALAELPNLSFLHLYGIDVHLPPIAFDLATEINQLQLVGLNRVLWDIDRTGTEMELSKWPRWKTKFCMEEDFDSTDDAWLFACH